MLHGNKDLSPLLKSLFQPIQYHACKLRFRHERVILGASVRVENLHMVRRHTEARILLRNVVRDDEIEVLFASLPRAYSATFCVSAAKPTRI